ncbi:hypothetical protein ILYODFUR_032869 [Ilyodon furcidens]|uniref:Uncharacterized protein n=1 Tax=Ilyodon furcidens TaxID=33524 RepID=A0ABV0UMC3_9TELE
MTGSIRANFPHKHTKTHTHTPPSLLGAETRPSSCSSPSAVLLFSCVFILSFFLSLIETLLQLLFYFVCFLMSFLGCQTSTLLLSPSSMYISFLLYYCFFFPFLYLIISFLPCLVSHFFPPSFLLLLFFPSHSSFHLFTAVSIPLAFSFSTTASAY